MVKKNIRVLVVDDTVLYRKILTDVLSTLPGVEIVGAVGNGQLALNCLASLKPDIMTLDFEMPVLDGISTLKQLQKHPSEVAVVMVSAHTLEGAKVTLQALELGAFDFIAKPSGSSLQENRQALLRQLKPVIQSVATKRLLARTSSMVNRVAPTSPAVRQPVRSPSGAPPRGVAPPVRAPLRPTGGIAGIVQIVAIGVSTGGPNALAELLPKLPGNMRVPIVLVQHMPPVFTKALADSLNSKCALSVVEVKHGDRLQPGVVHIAPGGKQMRLKKQGTVVTVELTTDPPENHCRPSVDYLFRSVAEVYNNNTLGVILTGMGNDGAKGLQVMKGRGSQVIGQDQQSCVVYGMPMEAVKAGVVDIELPLNKIADEIVKRVK